MDAEFGPLCISRTGQVVSRPSTLHPLLLGWFVVVVVVVVVMHGGYMRCITSLDLGSRFSLLGLRQNYCLPLSPSSLGSIGALWYYYKLAFLFLLFLLWCCIMCSFLVLVSIGFLVLSLRVYSIYSYFHLRGIGVIFAINRFSFFLSSFFFFLPKIFGMQMY